MSAYKKLNKQDVYVTSYVAHKTYNAISQSGDGDGLSTYGIDTFFAYSSSGDYYPSPFDNYTTRNGNTRNGNLVYKNIYQLYYSNFISGSLKQQSGSFDNFVQSGWTDYTSSRNLQTEASIIDIPRKHVGTHIRPSSFVFKISGSTAINAYSSSYILCPTGSNTASADPGTVAGNGDGDYVVGAYIDMPTNAELVRTGTGVEYIDDGEGSLILSASSELSFTSSVKIGDIIYPHGLAIITSEVSTSLANEDLDITWKASHPIYTYNIRCKVRDYEMNFTQNPSAISGSDGILHDNMTGSAFNPYVTSVGLYNDANELLAVGKFSQPIPKSEDTDMSFVIKLDM